MFCLCTKPCVLGRKAGGLFLLRCAGSTASVGTDCGIAAEREPLWYDKGIVMRRTLRGTKWLSRWKKKNTSVECRTSSRNFGCHYSRTVEAVWNKQVELTGFCAGYAFESSFVSDYHTENKGNMTGRCKVYWCAVPPVFCTLLCCLELFCVSGGPVATVSVHIAVFVLNWDGKYMCSEIWFGFKNLYRSVDIYNIEGCVATTDVWIQHNMQF